MTSTQVIQARGISKQFTVRADKSLKDAVLSAVTRRSRVERFWALKDVDLEVDAGQTVGLVGHNGSGKSTLLKMIGGIIQPTTGTMYRRGRLAALLELGAGFHPDLTGRENVFLNSAILGLSRRQTERHFDEIVDFSGVERFIDTQVKFYSSGMYVRLAFAVAVHVDPDVLLVDEVLAVGDEPFQRRCLDRIRTFQSEGRTIVMVSHALDQVADLCQRAVVLDHGVVRADGPPEDSLRVLRADYVEQEHVEAQVRLEHAHELEANAAVVEPSSPMRQAAPAARVREVRLCSPDGAEVRELRSGQPVDVHVTVEVLEDRDDVNIGFGIESNTGTVLYGTNTHLQGRAVEPGAGRRTAVFRIRALEVGEGTIGFSAAVASTDGHEWDRRVDAVRAVTYGRGRSIGVLDLDVALAP
jgi:ABC-2 type transport system ATP-binding protein